MEQPRVDRADRKEIQDLLFATTVDCYDDFQMHSYICKE